MPAGIGLAGKLNFDTGLAVDGGVVRIAPINVTVTDLDAAQGEKHFREPKVTLGGSAEANPAARSAKVSDLKCDFSAGSFAVESLERPGLGGGAGRSHRDDHRRAGPRARARLVQGFRRAAAGNERRRAGEVHAEGRRARGQAVGQPGRRGDLAQSHAGDRAGDRGTNLTLAAAADIAPAAQTVTLNSLAIKSSFYSLDAKGSLADWGKARNLTLDGTQECNWDKIGPLVAAFSGKPVEMSGRTRLPCTSSCRWAPQGASALLASAIANASVHVGLIKYMGLETAASTCRCRSRTASLR